MSKKPTLYLLDTLALIYRAHFALHQYTRVNSKGLEVGALLGFANSLVEILQKREPTYVIAAFDTHEPTWRKKLYPEYKAKRQTQPEAITAAIPYAKQLLNAFGIPHIEKSGYEADDIIGTIALKAVQQALDIYIVSPDKDLGQLVRQGISIYKPSNGKKPAAVWKEKEVLAHWGIPSVHFIPDMIGLWGDSSDNIPGVPNVGPKTAQKLITSYGSLEQILVCQQLPDKLKVRLQAHKAQALLSKKLAVITTDIPLDINLEDGKYKGFKPNLLKPLLQTLEFHTLSRRLFQSTTRQLPLFGTTSDGQLFHPAAQEQDKDQPTTNLRQYDASKVTYRCLEDINAIQACVAQIQQQPAFCFDTETSGLNPYTADLLGVSLSYEKGKAYYIPIPGNPHKAQSVLSILAPIFTNDRQCKVGQNIKFDIQVLREHGLNVGGPFFDTMIAHHLLLPTAKHNLTALAHQYLEYDPIPIETLIGKKGKNQRSMRDVPLDNISVYACEDADITWQVYKKLMPALKTAGMAPLFYTLEMKLLPVLTKMEKNGIAIDVDKLEQIAQTFGQQATTLAQRIYQAAGCSFNIASPKQLGQVLFERLNIEKKPSKTTTGQYATHEGILKKLQQKHPIIGYILDYRELSKLKSTYVDALPALLEQDGRLHTSFQQGFVATGRLSSTKPNLQNIPIRTARGQEIRKAFVAGHAAYTLLSADYSQIELRIMAHFAQDASMIDAFKARKDIHTLMAARIFNIDEKQVDPAMRRVAKTTNFGLIYGISPFGLARSLGISRTEAAEIITTYFNTFPGIKNYMERIVESAKEKGYVTTLLGRKRPLPDIRSKNATMRHMAERNAINMPIQGTAAELIQRAMIDIDAWLVAQKIPAKMVLQVHDELIFEVHTRAVDALKKHIPLLMANAVPLSVPIEVNVGVGDNWLAAH